MSQSIEAPASPGRVPSGRGSDMTSEGKARPAPSASAILFNELVLAHFRWFALHGRYGEFGGLPAQLAPAGWPPDPPPTDAERKAAEADYRDKLEQFTSSEGDIVAAYWSTIVPSGIVMTMRPRGWALDLLLGPTISLHRATTWLTASDPQVAELLHHCDSLGNKAAQILTHTPKRVAMTWIFSTESYLLGVVEGRSWGAIPGGSATNGHRELKTVDALAEPTSENAETPVAEGAVQAGPATKPADEPTNNDLVLRGAPRSSRSRSTTTERPSTPLAFSTSGACSPARSSPRGPASSWQ